MTDQPSSDSGDPLPDNLEPRRVDEFVRLLGQHQRRLCLFVMGLVGGRWADAEEILQETNLVLWREFHQFQLGTNFAAWACRVALNQSLAWQKRRQRDRLQFSDDFLEAVAEESIAAVDALDARVRHLSGCLDKLPADQRQLVRLRYTDSCSIDEIATRSGRTVAAVYRALSRIRRALHDCVSHRTALENA